MKDCLGNRVMYCRWPTFLGVLALERELVEPGKPRHQVSGQVGSGEWPNSTLYKVIGNLLHLFIP